LRNYQSILSTLNLLLKDSGKLFIHIFCHKSLLYLYEIQSDSDWMTKYFFQGGIMPSLDIFEHFDESFRLADRWSVNGRNYSKTSKLWLMKMYQNRAQIMHVLSQHYDDPWRWFNRWRIFFLTCEVFFALNDGDEYFVSHHLLEKNPST
jgi:cyclopropane-fatty-acyl-phospholipid synthase